MPREPQKKPRQKFIRSSSGELLDTRGLALALNESPFTIRNWRRAGLIPCIDAGYRSKRFLLEDVRAALRKRILKAK